MFLIAVARRRALKPSPVRIGDSQQTCAAVLAVLLTVASLSVAAATSLVHQDQVDRVLSEEVR